MSERVQKSRTLIRQELHDLRIGMRQKAVDPEFRLRLYQASDLAGLMLYYLPIFYNLQQPLRDIALRAYTRGYTNREIADEMMFSHSFTEKSLRRIQNEIYSGG